MRVSILSRFEAWQTRCPCNVVRRTPTPGSCALSRPCRRITAVQQGADVTDGACKPEDIVATILKVLGIDPRKEYHTGRPITLVREGSLIQGIVR